MISLTPRQYDLLAFLEDWSDPWIEPSYEEMRAALGLGSKSSVARLLDGIEERGYIRRVPGQARSTQLLHLLPTSVLINGEPYRYIPKSRAA